MALKLSLPQLLADLASDGATVGFDLPGGLYDRIHQFIEERNVLPRSNQGRLATVAALLLATRIVEQQFGTLGPLSRIAHNVSSDAVREEAKRILETGRGTATKVTAKHSLFSVDESTRRKLSDHVQALTGMEQHSLRATLATASPQELNMLAALSTEDVRVLLRLLPSEPLPPSHQITSKE